jgi:hypothetical protein
VTAANAWVTVSKSASFVRDAAKRANFGFVFGGGVRSYRQTTLEDYGLVLTDEEGKRDQAAFREVWTGVYAW